MVRPALDRGYEVVGVCREQSVAKLDVFWENIHDRLQLGGADHGAEHAANRLLLLLQPLVALRERL